MKISLVVPCYNEEGNVVPFYKETVNAFRDSGLELELVFVNDGSTDGTLTLLKKLTQGPVAVKVVDFSRNFGKEAAVLAGLQNATGDYVTVIDADLQQRPEIALEMVHILEQDATVDCVAAYQKERTDSKVLTVFKELFYSIINGISETEFRQGASDFRTFRRAMADAIISMQEYHRFSKGIFSWVGFNTQYIPYTAEERANGTSKWSFVKLFKYATDGIEAFSVFPLRIPLLLGILFTLLSLPLFIIFMIAQRYVDIAVIFFVGGVVLLSLGIVGEYLSKVYIQGKDRPIYIVRKIYSNEEK